MKVTSWLMICLELIFLEVCSNIKSSASLQGFDLLKRLPTVKGLKFAIIGSVDTWTTSWVICSQVPGVSERLATLLMAQNHALRIPVPSHILLKHTTFHPFPQCWIPYCSSWRSTTPNCDRFQQITKETSLSNAPPPEKKFRTLSAWMCLSSAISRSKTAMRSSLASFSSSRKRFKISTSWRSLGGWDGWMGDAMDASRLYVFPPFCCFHWFHSECDPQFWFFFIFHLHLATHHFQKASSTR